MGRLDYLRSNLPVSVRQTIEACYDDGVCGAGQIFGICQRRFLASANLVEHSDETVEKLRGMDSVDHRTMWLAHTLLAAWYRKKICSYQLTLPFNGEDAYASVLKEWRTWFEATLEDLCRNDQFVRLVCRAGAFPNPSEIGKKAEDELDELLLRHFPLGENWFHESLNDY